MSEDEYQRLKRFMGLFYEWFLASPHHRPESHPLFVLETIEKKSRSQAKRGLEMALNDCVASSSEWPSEAVALADKRFALNDAPSLTEVRVKYLRKYRQILKRGRIKNLQECYLAKGILDGGGMETGSADFQKLAAMLDDYESSIAGQIAKGNINSK